MQNKIEKKGPWNSRLFILFLIFPIFFPASLNYMFNDISTWIYAWQCVNLVLVILIKVIQYPHISKIFKSMVFLWILFLICILIVVDNNLGGFKTWLTIFAPVMILLISAEITTVKSNNKFVKVVADYLFVLLIINFALLLLFPDGFAHYSLYSYDGLNNYVFKSNFMASDNMIGPFNIAAMFFAELRYKLVSPNRALRMFTWLIGGLTAVIIWSATGLVGYFIFLIALIVNNSRKSLKKHSILNMKNITIIGIVLFIIIIIFRLQSIFSFLIVSVLKKDISLSSRTEIWNLAYTYIKQSPIFGWGNTNYGSIILWNYYYWYAHNLILDIFLQGGILTTLAFLNMIRVARKSIHGQSNRVVETICSACFFAFIVMNMTESHFSSVYLYIPLIIGSVYYEKDNFTKNIYK